MNNLIAISPATIGDIHTESVDARDLHSALEVGRDFTTWIKARIDGFQFKENHDFILLTETGEQKAGFFSRGGHNRVDYLLSIDMAKELAMLERSDKGREVRRYFISREREAIEKGQSLEAVKQALLAARPDYASIVRYTGMGLEVGEIGKLIGKSAGAVRHEQIKLEKACLLVRPITRKRLALVEENPQLSLLDGGVS